MNPLLKAVSLCVALIVPFATLQAANAQETNFQIRKVQNPEAYVSVSIENLDSPNQPITVGQRFRIKASCVVDISAILGRNIKTDSVGQMLTKEIIPTDPNTWYAVCNIFIGQKQNKQFELEGNWGQESVPVSWQSPTIIPFFEETARAESSEEIFVTGSTLLFSTNIKYTRKDGSRGRDSIEFYNDFYEYSLLSPLAKKKTNSAPRIVELDGEEESEEEPIFQIKKESSSAYLITLLNYRTNFEARIRATKKGNKTYTFVAKTDSDGDLSIRAKRNLKGYKLDLLENAKSIISKVVSS
jgi:hypothetical protein